jgi:hypothetical protein
VRCRRPCRASQRGNRGAKARGETITAEEALDVWIVSVCPGNEEAEGWLEKKEPTLLVPIGGTCMAAESIGRERRAAAPAWRLR